MSEDTLLHRAHWGLIKNCLEFMKRYDSAQDTEQVRDEALLFAVVVFNRGNGCNLSPKVLFEKYTGRSFNE